MPKQRKHFLPALGREWSKTYQQLDDKEIKQYWSKIWERREHNRNTEWIGNMGKEFERLKYTQKSTKLENPKP